MKIGGRILAACLLTLLFAMPASAYNWQILDDSTGRNCTLFGTWDSATRTCTLTRNAEGFSINSSGVTLDGDRFNCNGVATSMNSVTVKNCNNGPLSLGYSSNALVTGNIFSGTHNIYSVAYSIIRGNTFIGGIYMQGALDIQIYNNNFLFGGITNWQGQDNIFSLNAPIGGNYYDIYDSVEEGCTDSNIDGFCDAPLYFYADGADYLPLMQPIDLTAPITKAFLNGGCSGSTCYTDVIISLDAHDDFSGVAEIHYILDGGQEAIVNGGTSDVVLTEEGSHTVEYYAIDIAGNVEAWKSSIISIDKSDNTPPSISVSATPSTLQSSGQRLLVDVLIEGSVTDDYSGVASYSITVTDEYGVYNYVVPNFGAIVQLEAWRAGQDSDGRHYVIDVIASDLAGNIATASTEVVVPH